MSDKLLQQISVASSMSSNGASQFPRRKRHHVQGQAATSAGQLAIKCSRLASEVLRYSLHKDVTRPGAVFLRPELADVMCDQSRAAVIVDVGGRLASTI